MNSSRSNKSWRIWKSLGEEEEIKFKTIDVLLRGVLYNDKKTTLHPGKKVRRHRHS